MVSIAAWEEGADAEIADAYAALTEWVPPLEHDKPNSFSSQFDIVIFPLSKANLT
jgi:hypothetical protein